MAGFVYEVSCFATIRGKVIANIYHVWDGDEAQDPDDVADVFQTHHLPDLAAFQVDDVTWSRINVVPLDVGNTHNAVSRVIAIAGADAGEDMNTGAHVWIKFISDDNGFKSGGKLFGGFGEGRVQNGQISAASLTSIQTIYDDLLTDLTTAGLALAIYRPSLSTPGFPSISISSAVLARGIGTNNRRQQPFQK